MKKYIGSNTRELYVVFSKAFFVPKGIENINVYAEPFCSAIKSFQEWVSLNLDEHESPLWWGKLPFLEKGLFIPNIGKIKYDHKNNIASQLLLGSSSSYSYKSSIEKSEILHLPLLIDFNKTIKLTPTLSDFFQKSQKLKNKPRISHKNKLHIHFYPYGLCFIHLAVSIDSEEFLETDSVIRWLRLTKSAKDLSG